MCADCACLCAQVACNQRGRNASQLNIGGTHLGSFNDRFRDALMGGSPFASPRYQGFATGLATAPNAFTQAHTVRVFRVSGFKTRICQGPAAC